MTTKPIFILERLFPGTTEWQPISAYKNKDKAIAERDLAHFHAHAYQTEYRLRESVKEGPGIRYFKATDGIKTYFRASPSRAYLSMSRVEDYKGWVFHLHNKGMFPVTEIDAVEYRALAALKKKRDSYATAPRDSWVFNCDV